MINQRIDTRAIGLDVGLKFMSWLTGAENLHYGLWTGLEVNAANLGAAQAAYTDKLFKLLPPAPARILDIGGGAGEPARKLIDLGYDVDIVVPSEFLATRCRENAPAARVHLMKFEDFETADRFDVCLFSESFQYITVDQSLPKANTLLRKGGVIVIADCFRSENFVREDLNHKVGGGHALHLFQDAVPRHGFVVTSEEDITAAVAPSVDLEQQLFNVIGFATTRIDAELQAKKPKTRWFIARAFGLFSSERRRVRLDQRLNHKTRNADAFCYNNRYLMLILERA